MTNARVTRQAVEVLANAGGTPTARVTRQAVEVLANAGGTPAARVTRQAVEVLVSGVIQTATTHDAASVVTGQASAAATAQRLKTLASNLSGQASVAAVAQHLQTLASNLSGQASAAAVAQACLAAVSILNGSASTTAAGFRIHYGLRCIIPSDRVFAWASPSHTPTTYTLNGFGFGEYTGVAVFSDDLLENFSNEETITAQDNWTGEASSSDRSDMKRVNNGDSRIYNKPCITNVSDLTRNEELVPVTEKNGALVYDLGTALAELEPLVITAWVKMASTATDPITGKWGLLRLSNTDSTADHNGCLSFVRWHDRFNVTPIHAGNSGWEKATFIDSAQEEPWPDITESGSWVRMDYHIIPSTIGERNGTIQMYQYDNSGVEPRQKVALSMSYPIGSPWGLDGDIQLLSSGAEKFRYVIFQNLFGEGDLANNSNDVWLDSVMIQRGSIKRVELCDNADYTLATHCEIQKIIRWEDIQIELQIKQGSLPAGTGYLHVINEDNISIYSEAITLY